MREVVSIAVVALLAARLASADTPSPAAAADLAAVRDSATAFAIASYRSAEKSDDNYFFSPLSVSIALGTLYGGARGETERQLAATMQTGLGQERYHRAFGALRAAVNDSLKKSRVNLSTAKLLATQTGFPLQEAFVALARDQYGSELFQVDFQNAPDQAQSRINDWVKEHS